MRRWVMACGIAAAAAPALAQELITPGQFLDIAEGKTLTFHNWDTGSFFGIEQFLSRSLSVWRETGKDCVYGRVTAEGRELCFRYDNAPERLVCWLPFRHGDRLLVRLARFSDPEVQEIVGISEDPIPCPNAPTS